MLQFAKQNKSKLLKNEHEQLTTLVGLRRHLQLQAQVLRGGGGGGEDEEEEEAEEEEVDDDNQRL